MDNLSSPEDKLNLSATLPPVPWTLRDVVGGLGVFGLWILFFLLVGLVGRKLDLPVDAGLVIVFGEAVLLLPAWYFTIHKYGTSWADLGFRGFAPLVVGVGCGLMLVSFLFNLVYAALLAGFGLRVQPDIAPLFESTASPLLLFLGGAVVAPVVEEVFFRGFVFRGLQGRWSWPWAALVSAVLFALAHVVPTSILPIFILGFIFAFLYQASGSIWPAIMMHMLTNSLALGAAYALSQGWISLPQ